MTGNLFIESGQDKPAAIFSPCRNYRYTLFRRWENGPTVSWLMFNPSTADEFQLDPTLRKCKGFSQRWGYGAMAILNLYAIRGTDPKTPSKTVDPVGPDNDKWISEIVRDSEMVVYAWGCAQHMKTIGLRINEVRCFALLHGKKEVCLGYREDGHPRHPLMLSYETQRIPFGGM